MSEPEGFLARWTRRKREAQAETARTPASAPESKPDESPRIAGPSGSATPSAARDTRTGSTGTAPSVSEDAAAETFDIASLPPIESITATTDIRAFMAPGVPPELTRAALRRAWSADPAIRDFVGIAENQWDFTAPNEILGFGPLDSGEDIARLVAKVFGDPLPDSSPEPQDAGAGANASVAADAEKDPQRNSIEEARQPACESETEATPGIVQCGENNLATQYSTAAEDDLAPERPRGHGGALPQ
jgi:hypothetical protein